ncbi:unnamed protein product [Periconia digitata]|uniref:Uncharacterized protein n=1 Tax=Periconia digitata TaxID=1303443 RepID=A0A9W4U1R6_9PLEO|nr:unnamed protein product [Periconia digitata]
MRDDCDKTHPDNGYQDRSSLHYLLSSNTLVFCVMTRFVSNFVTLVRVFKRL